jgi:hypothetical protein
MIDRLAQKLLLMNAMQNPESDRRGAPRRRVYFGAKIFLSDGKSVFDCVVRDLSTSGARLSLGQFQAIPKRFTLLITELGTFQCELVRAVGNEYGIRFIETEPIVEGEGDDDEIEEDEVTDGTGAGAEAEPEDE